MSVIGDSYGPVTPDPQDSVDMYQTHRRWWTVADAARLLRVNIGTLYAAIAADDFPHVRWEGTIRVPCEALRMTYVPSPDVVAISRKLHTYLEDDVDQLALPLDPSCLVPARLYRNGERKRAHAYEHAQWRVKP